MLPWLYYKLDHNPDSKNIHPLRSNMRQDSSLAQSEVGSHWNHRKLETIWHLYLSTGFLLSLHCNFKNMFECCTKFYCQYNCKIVQNLIYIFIYHLLYNNLQWKGWFHQMLNTYTLIIYYTELHSPDSRKYHHMSSSRNLSLNFIYY